MKKFNLIRFAAILSVVLLGSMFFTSCDDLQKDRFTDSEIIQTWTFGSTETNCYKSQILFTKPWQDGKCSGTAAILDTLSDEKESKYWNYFIQYQVNYSTEEDISENNYSFAVVRRIYCKSKTDALEAYEDVVNNFNEDISVGTSGRQYYGIDYEIDVLMSDNPVSMKVINMTGEKFKNSEILYDFKNSEKDFLHLVYEKREVLPFVKLDDGTYRYGAISLHSTSPSIAADGFNYVVFYELHYYDQDEIWQDCIERQVYCQTKTESKMALKMMLDYYKRNKEKIDSLELNSEDEGIKFQSYGYDFNLENLFS